MTYKEAEEYINELGKKGSVLGLTAIKELLKRLDEPQERLAVIHVAGTNGKGSICTFLEAMYRAEGKRVGRYISPTIDSYLERFQINGKAMSEEQFGILLSQVKAAIEGMKKDGVATPTVFEAETAVAFLYFLEEQADIVILETGMGGREDATNVVSKPLCTVFAQIGMDHMQFLGDTLEQIAYEKAGIIKDGCPAVSYPNEKKVLDVLEQECSLHNTKLNAILPEEIEILDEGLTGSRFCYKGVKYAISLAGEYQIYNAATAIETKLLLDGKVNGSSLHNIKWPARFETLSEAPLFIRDGAHNVDGARALQKSMEKHFTNRRIIFIIGVLKDKEYEKMMSLLCPRAEDIYTITPPGPRGLSAALLRDCIRPYCKKVFACENVTQAMEFARLSYESYEAAGEPAVIIAWGSLSYMGQITNII